MIKLLGSTLWPQLNVLYANSKRKLAAVAYVSSDENIRFGKGDLLIVDASDERISSGDTSKDVISKAFRRGATIYSLPNLHAKVLIFDEVLVIGSSNISASSKYRLHEVGIVTNEPDLVNNAKKLISQFKSKAQKVDQAFLAHIRSVPTKSTIHTSYGRSLSSKPSLLNLLCSSNNLLDDFAIVLYEQNPTLSSREIKKKAKSAEIKLPPKDKWTWYEDSLDTKTLSACKRFFEQKDLKAIGFHVTSDDDKITAFNSVDRAVQIYINHFRIRKKLILNFIDDSRAPFNFGEKELIGILNKSLKTNPKAGKRLFDKTAWIFTAKEFSQILGFR